MNLEEFDYYLPQELIAQTPLAKRDEARLMVLNRKTGEITHRVFHDVIDYMEAGDALVINDTKVLPARLIGVKEETGAIIEILLLKDVTDDVWTALAKPAKRVKVGTIISFGDGLLKARCIEVQEEGIRKFELIYDGILMEILDQLGTMPLPPYIHEELKDQSMYQTVYAKNLGSAAAPTAGLHFTKELLDKIKAKGILILPVTLHVGLGTFRPVQEEDITKHHMHSEYYMMSKEVAEQLNQVKASHHRIFACGTTSVRTLETIMEKYGRFQEAAGNTSIFIYPGYQYRAIDGLITNFHLPKSTLVMLVSAFATREYILHAYEEAVKDKYRFFSFGDAMLIL